MKTGKEITEFRWGDSYSLDGLMRSASENISTWQVHRLCIQSSPDHTTNSSSFSFAGYDLECADQPGAVGLKYKQIAQWLTHYIIKRRTICL